MIAQVSIDAEGSVTVLVDSDDVTDDDDTRALIGLSLDDMLGRAAETAVCTWLELRVNNEAGE